MKEKYRRKYMKKKKIEYKKCYARNYDAQFQITLCGDSTQKRS